MPVDQLSLDDYVKKWDQDAFDARMKEIEEKFERRQKEFKKRQEDFRRDFPDMPQTPEDLAERWRNREALNEERRAMALNEKPGWPQPPPNLQPTPPPYTAEQEGRLRTRFSMMSGGDWQTEHDYLKAAGLTGTRDNPTDLSVPINQQGLSPEESDMLGFKSIGMEINGEEFNVPALWPNMTPEQQAIIKGYDHTKWPKPVLDKIKENARDFLENQPFSEPTPIPPQVSYPGSSGGYPRPAPSPSPSVSPSIGPMLAGVGRLAQVGEDIEMHNASELAPDDPRWEAIAKALGVDPEKLKTKNNPYYRPADEGRSEWEQQRNQNMRKQEHLQRLERAADPELKDIYHTMPIEPLKGSGEQFRPNYVPIRGNEVGQPYYDPASALGVDPIMAALPPPPPTPGQLPTPPGTGGYGPIGQTVADVFSPAPPGTDPMSFRPTDLLRQLREGFISDEDIAEIQRDPKSWASLAAYGLAAANAAININRGARKGERLNWRIVPGKEWDAMKVVQEPMVGSGGEVVRPSVRQDDAGNFFEYQGSHVVQGVEGPDKHHIIAIPVEGPTGSEGWKQRHADWMKEKTYGGIEPGSPEWFDKKAKDFQAKNFPKGPTNAAEKELSDYNTPGPDTPAQKAAERARQLKQAQSDYLESLKKGPHSEDDAAAWKHYIEEELGGTLPKEKPKTEEDYWKLYQEGKLPGQKGPPEQGPPSPTGKFKLPEGSDFPNQPPEEVGPVDWNWYNPVGGKNPPYEPPYRDYWSWEPEGAPPSDYSNRFNWEPPREKASQQQIDDFLNSLKGTPYEPLLPPEPPPSGKKDLFGDRMWWRPDAFGDSGEWPPMPPRY